MDVADVLHHCATDWRGRGLLYFTMHVFLHKPQKHHCSIVYMCVHTSSPTHSPAWPAPGSRCMDVQKQWRVRTPNKVTSIALDRCGHIIYVIITVRSLMVYVRVASRNRTLARITVLRKWPIKFTERKSSFFRRPKVATSSYWWEIVAYSLLAKGGNAKKRKPRVSKNRTRQ